MAYMCSIKTTCDKDGCRKPRTHRVYSRINDRMGDYCKRHAEQRLDDLQATEDKNDARASAQPTEASPADTMRAHLETFGKP